LNTLRLLRIAELRVFPINTQFSLNHDPENACFTWNINVDWSIIWAIFRFLKPFSFLNSAKFLAWLNFIRIVFVVTLIFCRITILFRTKKTCFTSCSELLNFKFSICIRAFYMKSICSSLKLYLSFLLDFFCELYCIFVQNINM